MKILLEIILSAGVGAILGAIVAKIHNHFDPPGWN